MPVLQIWIVVSGLDHLTLEAGLTTDVNNADQTAMSHFLAGIEGSGVFLCGYIVPVVGNLFGGGAGMNIMVSGIILMVDRRGGLLCSSNPPTEMV